MKKKVVLVVDEDSRRAEKLLFIVRLGGYETQTFGSTAAALNWVKYGCSVGEVLCLLFNHPGKEEQAGEIFATWAAAGKTVPVVLVQREKGNWNHLLTLGEKDHFFVCEPENVMQVLDLLSAIECADKGAAAGSEKFLASGEASSRDVVSDESDPGNWWMGLPEVENC